MVPKIYFVENLELKMLILSSVNWRSCKTKTSDLFNEISYLSQDNFIPNQLSVKSISLSINGEHVMIFIMTEIIQSFSNRKIAQLSDGELRHLEIKLLCSPVKFVL
jgi:hypothetical protein